MNVLLFERFLLFTERSAASSCVNTVIFSLQYQIFIRSHIWNARENVLEAGYL